MKWVKAKWQREHQRRVAEFPPDGRDAHNHSSRHRDEILASTLCGCFYCKQVFPPSEIEDWVDETEDGVGQTALCPRCGIDSLIGDKSGFEISERFMAEMYRYWF